MRKRLLTVWAMMVAVLPAGAQQPAPQAEYRLLQGHTAGETVQLKNYYLLSLLERTPAVKKVLQEDSVLTGITRSRKAMTDSALLHCKEAFCYTAQLQFSREDIDAVSGRLFSLYHSSAALQQLVKQQLIPSGAYYLYNSLSADSLLVKAWEQDAKGINFVIGVYAEGRKPNYPNIDSIAFPVTAKAYTELVYDATATIQQECGKNACFFAIPLRAALCFLELNERDNAADYEPMAEGENKAACSRMATINWNNYRYSVIMVPGAGPEEQGVALSAEGMLRCRVAALRYREGLAPFVVVSGGKVHPYKTKFCEALEMKRFMVKELGLPENAVIIEPHARHTTTNMRNTVRLIFRYHMPFDKPAITSTSRSQSNAIARMDDRCRKELHMVPYRQGKRLSETELEFYPALEALQINPAEPMDP